ncbi:MAG: hypothetical protein HOG15_06670 [Anaerolineae bacterium]|jgi:preprotein translocase subunit SecB|nr:hypothetical protein [Anaerolineae bacterium]
MTNNQKNELAEEKTSIDVTSPETHYIVQCNDIRLISSSLRPLVSETEVDEKSSFTFRVKAVVEGNIAYSYLEVQTSYYIPDSLEGVQGFQLSYVLMGTFNADEEMNSTDLAHFIKMYTLSILWPYAREYASDQLRRAGESQVILPIINPQVVTEHIVENNLVEVEIVKENEQ